MASGKRYLQSIVLLFALTLLPIALLNLLLERHSLDAHSKAIAAAEWQRSSHGITYMPVMEGAVLFKTLRLNDRLPDIDGVVLGSSTAMSITAQQFPAPIRLYNFGKSANPLLSAIGDGEYLVEHTQVQWFVIPLDWSIDSLIGTLYRPGTPHPADLSRPDLTTQPAADTPSWRARLLDALSYPRILSLWRITQSILHAPDKRSAFRQYFLQEASDEYRCPDGTPAKDFDTLHRGICAGLRYDGSVTYAESERVVDPQPLIASALMAGSVYSRSLLQSGGEPNPVALQHIAALARNAEAKGGGAILLLPPLLPGLEVAVLKHPQTAAALQHTKEVLRDWAIHNNLVILDAGQSERFGCTPGEFVDHHHAVSACYDKVWHYFWSQVAHAENGKVTLPQGGLY